MIGCREARGEAFSRIGGIKNSSPYFKNVIVVYL